MKLVTTKSLIQNLVTGWREKNPWSFNFVPWTDENGRTRKAVGKDLDALDLETATPHDVEQIGGRNLAERVTLVCSDCQTQVPEAVEGCETEIDAGVWLCRDCIMKAAALFPPISKP